MEKSETSSETAACAPINHPENTAVHNGTNAETTSSGMNSITVNNNSSYTVTALFITPNSKESWGRILLDRYLYSGQSIRINNIPDGEYDMDINNFDSIPCDEDAISPNTPHIGNNLYNILLYGEQSACFNLVDSGKNAFEIIATSQEHPKPTFTKDFQDQK